MLKGIKMEHINMKRIIYILVISLMISSYCEAQVSGYMGKRWLFMYDINARPTFSNPNQNGNTGFTSLNVKNTFGLEFVAGRHLQMGVSYSYFNTCFDFDGLSIFTSPDNMLSTYSPTAIGNISVKGVSYFMKFFYSDNLAPLGTYTKIQLDHYSWDWSFSDVNNPPPSGFVTSGSKSSYGLSLCVGNQRIFYDRIILNVSLQTGYLFSGYNHSDLEDQYSINGNSDRFMELITSNRVFVHYLWSFNVGIGVLIF